MGLTFSVLDEGTPYDLAHGTHLDLSLYDCKMVGIQLVKPLDSPLSFNLGAAAV